MIRFLALNAIGALLLLAAAGAGVLFVPFQADATHLTVVIAGLFFLGLSFAAHGAWEKVQWLSRRLVRLGLLGTLIGFAIALAALDTNAFSDISSLRASGAALLTGAGVAVHTSIIGWIGSLWLDLNRWLLQR